MRTLILLLAVAPALSLRAQNPVPPIVQQGLDALKRGKCQDAFDLWTKTWPDMQKAQMTASCSALQQFGGELRGYDVLRTVDITPHLSRVYVVLLYEIQPVYVMVVVYRPGDTEARVATVNWNTDPDKVVPASIIPPQRPGEP